MYTPVRKYGFLIKGQSIKVCSGKFAGREGVILGDKSSGYIVNITPDLPTITQAVIPECDFVTIERLSMFTTVSR